MIVSTGAVKRISCKGGCRCSQVSHSLIHGVAEIVLEREVLPHERMMEGPFGEYMDYEAGKSSPKSIMKINAITYRHDPILPFSNMGMPVHEGQTATALIKGVEVYSELRKLGTAGKGGVLSTLCSWTYGGRPLKCRL